MIIRNIVLVVFVALLGACATQTQVQLYSEYLSQQDIQLLVSLLEANDFEVVQNDLSIPQALVASTIIYSPLNRNIDQVNNLVDLVSETSFGSPQLELTGKGNHFYGRRVVGLYLLPEEIIAQRKSRKPTRISPEYNGRCDNAEAILVLADDGTLTLTRYQWDEQTKQEFEKRLTGQWWQTDEVVSLMLDGMEPVEFAVKRRITDGEQAYREYRLENFSAKSFYDNCRFVYRELLN